MKNITSIGVLSVLSLAGAALAQRSREQNKPSMRGMIEKMKEGERTGEGHAGGWKHGPNDADGEH